MKPDLLPCPFCGGPGRIASFRPEHLSQYYTAICSECCAEIGSDADTEAEAAAAWNRRVPDKQAARIEALESALRNFQAYGCPVCHGDCGSANPPVLCCPMREAQIALSGTASAEPIPISMVLHCPKCGLQHIDAPSPGWDNSPHKSHLCHGCGTIWRPASVHTTGVKKIEPLGTHDNWQPGTTPPDGLTGPIGDATRNVVAQLYRREADNQKGRPDDV